MATPLERALAAISDAERKQVAATPLPDAHRMDVERVMAMPHNQDGADKSWVWPAYEFCRGHFRGAKPS
jgi:hypothetical protein